MDVSSILKANI